MKMSTATLSALGSAVSSALGGSYVYAFLTADTRALSDITSAVKGSGVTPSAAGFASLTGSNGTSLNLINAGSPVVGASAISVSYSLSSSMKASAAGTATYLVLCDYSTMTSGNVLAVIPVGTDSSSPIVMDNTTIVSGDIIKLPALTFSIPIPS